MLHVTRIVPVNYKLALYEYHRQKMKAVSSFSLTQRQREVGAHRWTGDHFHRKYTD